MKSDQLLRAILPDVLIDNFDVVNYEKTDTRFDIWLDEKKVMMREDKKYIFYSSNKTRTLFALSGSYQVLMNFVFYI